MDNPPQTVAERPLRVTYRPLGSLVPSPHNARTHSPRQVEQMVASIREFGFTNPILIDPDGSVIAGHGRLLAAERTGRRFRGLDINPAYVDVALERWSAMTGGTPHLDRAGLDE